jgi:hypothetical protein
MTKHTAAHTAAGLFFALAAALIAAYLVVWAPTRPGDVAVAAVCGYWLAHLLRKHKMIRKGFEAGLAGAAVATAAVVFAPALLPLGVFCVLAARPAAHFLDPRKARVVRTTRGVKSPARKAAGGRPGRPGEKPHAPRRTTASRPASPRPASSPAPRARTAHGPAERPVPVPAPAWPELEPWRDSDALPWAGEALEIEPPKKLRRDKNRPTQVHRQICGGCAAGECAPGVCKSRGCECAAPAHDIAPF